MPESEYEAEQRRKRHEAVLRIAAMELEDVPDPETLSKQLAEAHDPGLPTIEEMLPAEPES